MMRTFLSKIPLAPIIVWMDLNTSLTWLIDFFIVVLMSFYLGGYLVGRVFYSWK